VADVPSGPSLDSTPTMQIKKKLAVMQPRDRFTLPYTFCMNNLCLSSHKAQKILKMYVDKWLAL
jgi:hypothetical protein